MSEINSAASRAVSNVVPMVQSDQFEAFWRAYPKHVGKPLARAKFEAITNGGLKTKTLDKDSGQYVEIYLTATAEEIIAAAKSYAKANMKTGLGNFGFKDDGKYLCHPATWLNQGRFEDMT